MEEHAVFLSRELKRRGHECFLGFVSEPEPDIRRRFEEAGARILTVYCGNTPLVGRGASLRAREMLALRRMVVTNRIDLVHVNFMGLTNPTLLGVYLSKAKIVFTEHASGAALHRGLIKHILSKCINAAISLRVSKYIGVSDFVRDRLRLTHHVLVNKTVTIHNGVNLDRFCPQDHVEARKELGLPVGLPIMCSVAMLIPEKGIQNLIQATSLLIQRYSMQDILLLVAGEGTYRRDLERLARELNISGNIRFLGRRSDVQTIIAASDVVVAPSVWEEAFGLIVAEAMACGRPVVASKVGGIPELIVDGENGFLVKPDDYDGLALILQELLTNPNLKLEMGNDGLKKSAKFGLQRAVSELIDLYEDVL